MGCTLLRLMLCLMSTAFWIWTLLRGRTRLKDLGWFPRKAPVSVVCGFLLSHLSTLSYRHLHPHSHRNARRRPPASFSFGLRMLLNFACSSSVLVWVCRFMDARLQVCFQASVSSLLRPAAAFWLLIVWNCLSSTDRHEIFGLTASLFVSLSPPSRLVHFAHSNPFAPHALSLPSHQFAALAVLR